MKRFKGLVLLLATAMLILGLATSAYAAVGNDVAGTEYQAPVEKLASLGILTGYEDGTVKPDQTITRAEFAAIVVRELNMQGTFVAAPTNFSDVDSTHWASGLINLATGRGILKGYPDGTFKPEAPVTSAEALTMLVRMLGYGPACDDGNWPDSYIARAAAIGVTKGVSVSANDAAKRGDVFKMAANSLDIDLMEQEEWGTETIWREQEGETIVTEYFDLVMVDEEWVNDRDYNRDWPVVDNVPMLSLDTLDANEIEFDNYKSGVFEVNEMFNPNNFLGMEVEIWVDEDAKYVAYIAENGEQEVIKSEFKGFFGNEIELDPSGDKYDLLADTVIYFNGREYEWSDFKTSSMVSDPGRPTTMAKVVLNDDDEVETIVLTDYAANDDSQFSGLVYEVDVEDEVICYYDEAGNKDEIDLDDADYMIVRDGAVAALADIDEDDVAFFFEIDDDQYLIEVSSKKAEGVVEKTLTTSNTALNGWDVFVDGVKYDVAANANNEGPTISTDNNDSIEELEFEDLEDLEGEEVVLYLDPMNNIRHIVCGDLEGGSELVGVVIEGAEGTAVKVQGGVPVPTKVELTILNAQGKELNWEFDPDDVDLSYENAAGKEIDIDDPDVDDFIDYLGFNSASKPVIFVEYDVDSDGDLESIVVKRLDGVNVSLDDSDIDEDDDTLSFGRNAYNVTNRTVFFDLTGDYDRDNNEIEDTEIAKWDDVKDKDDLVVSYLLDDEDVDYVIITEAEGGSLSSAGEYGVVVSFKKVSGDDAVTLLNSEGEQVTYVLDDSRDRSRLGRGDFIRYEVDTNEEIEVDIIYDYSYTGKTYAKDAEMIDDIADDAEDLDIDAGYPVFGLVTSNSSTSIKLVDVNGNKGSYLTGANTVFFVNKENDEFKIARGVSNDDVVVLIDTDDDGKTVDYVYIAKEDVDEDDFVVGGGEDPGEDPVDPDETPSITSVTAPELGNMFAPFNVTVNGAANVDGYKVVITAGGTNYTLTADQFAVSGNYGTITIDAPATINAAIAGDITITVTPLNGATEGTARTTGTMFVY